MSIVEKTFYFVIIFLLINIGCAHIPTSEYPVEMERELRAPFDNVWDSVLKIVKNSRGNIITKDKPSGLIVYNILDNELKSQIYMQVYLKNSLYTTNITLVRLVPKIRTGYYLKGIEKDFFETLQSEVGKK